MCDSYLEEVNSTRSAFFSCLMYFPVCLYAEKVSGKTFYQSKRRKKHHKTTSNPSCTGTISLLHLGEKNCHFFFTCWFTLNVAFAFILFVCFFLPDMLMYLIIVILLFVYIHFEQCSVLSYQYPQGSPQGQVGPRWSQAILRSHLHFVVPAT